MSKQKKPGRLTWRIMLIIIITASFISISIYEIIDNDFQKNGDSQLAAGEGAYYLAGKNGNFIELSSKGEIYEHTFKGKAKCIKTGTDISFLEEKDTDINGNQQLIITKTGNIYISSDYNYKGELIGTVEGAISGDIGNSHIAILTDKGELYMYGDNEYGGLGISETKKVDKFTKVENLPKAKKVICGNYYTFFLSTENEVYGCGTVIEDRYNAFVKFDIHTPVSDIECFGQTIMILDKEGYVYQLGRDLHNVGPLNRYSTFHVVPELKKVISLSEGENFFAVLDENNTIFYFGEKFVGKASEIPTKRKIKTIKNVKRIFCRGRYLYVLTEKTILRYNLKD